LSEIKASRNGARNAASFGKDLEKILKEKIICWSAF